MFCRSFGFRKKLPIGFFYRGPEVLLPISNSVNLYDHHRVINNEKEKLEAGIMASGDVSEDFGTDQFTSWQTNYEVRAKRVSRILFLFD